MSRSIRTLTLLTIVAGLTAASCGGGESGPSSAKRDQAAVVNAVGLGSLGMVLVNSKGLTLYGFRGDKERTSSCYGACAETWLPLLTAGKPEVGFGALEKELGTTERKDGTTQVTYAGHPVYEYAGNKKRGETNANHVNAFGGEWYALRDPEFLHEGPPSSYTGAAVVTVANVGELGQVLVDSEGFTLYEYSKDKGGTSACYGGCASGWPPLITEGLPKAGKGVVANKLGTIERNSGDIQVTYAGHPLYTYIEDTDAGTAGAEGYPAFGGYWYVLMGDGERVNP